MNKKKLMVFGIIGLFAVALVTAGLLNHYGLITWNTEIEQAVVLTGGSLIFGDSFTAGQSVTDCDFNVKNNAGIEAPIKFGTTCSNSEGADDGVRTESEIDWSTFGNERCDGIVTEIYGILELTTKDVDFGATHWDENNDAKAIIKYTLVGDTFNAEIIEDYGDDFSAYTLIYYKDQSDRFNSPAKAILATNVNKDLPYADDKNLADYDYCESEENYEHCYGAKIWLVPTVDINMADGTLTWSNAGNYLFETDLIVYSDEVNDVINLPANGGGFNFCVENDFALNLDEDTYTIETKINSVI